MKKILVTGGPVHAYLDDVKIITNKFRGGRMWQLALDLHEIGAEVTYLCSKHSETAYLPEFRVIRHDGIEEYSRLVLELAPQMDGVVLGAAVANLIPANPIKGKFPSHNYKPGDIIPIDFKIAPRIIDEVKKVAPKVHLFGFKLLSGVDHDELMRAAYKIVLEAKATAVFANDAHDLDQKYAVTKERGVHPMEQAELAGWIWEMLHDEYYSTEFIPDGGYSVNATTMLSQLLEAYKEKFLHVESGLIFGTVAVRDESGGFQTTARGKRELDSFTFVSRVDHEKHVVYGRAPIKATLNAPLLAKIFENPAVNYIVHYHQQVPNLPSYAYAPPGTVRDTIRPNHTSFNIEEHGCMLLIDKNGRIL